MFSEERRTEILSKLENEGRVLAKQLAAQFQVSIDSIRRDLKIMEDKGLLNRTHGGAIALKESSKSKQPITPDSHDIEMTAYQKGIAKVAVRLIKEDQTIFIGNAPVHRAMLAYFPKDIHFTVVTNAVEVAYQLKDSDINTYIIGGKINDSGTMTDAFANKFSSQMTYDICFVSADAIGETGLSMNTPETAFFTQNICEHSKFVVALMENDTFILPKFTRIYPSEKIDMIITNQDAPQEKINALKMRGVEIIAAIG